MNASSRTSAVGKLRTPYSIGVSLLMQLSGYTPKMKQKRAADRPDGRTAALGFIADQFPDVLVALLAGSVTTGHATATSDLDLVLLTPRPEAPYRETFHAHGWPIEAFVYSPTSYQEWFAADRQRRRPSLPTMCATGIVLKDTDGLAAQVQQEARALLEAGPEPLTASELAAARYRITDLLMDLEGTSEEEAPFILAALVPDLANLICDINREWRGYGKWLIRAVRTCSPELAEQLATTLATATKAGDIQPLLAFADSMLERVGGRLFEGYAAGKNAVE